MDGRLILMTIVYGVCWIGMGYAAWMLWKVWKDQ